MLLGRVMLGSPSHNSPDISQGGTGVRILIATDAAAAGNRAGIDSQAHLCQEPELQEQTRMWAGQTDTGSGCNDRSPVTAHSGATGTEQCWVKKVGPPVTV